MVVDFLLAWESADWISRRISGVLEDFTHPSLPAHTKPAWRCEASSIGHPPHPSSLQSMRLESDEKAYLSLMLILSLPWWLRQRRICLQCRRPRFDPRVRKIPWRKEWQLTPVFLPGESHRQESLMGSIRSQRVRHDWVTNTLTSTHSLLWVSGKRHMYFFFYLLSPTLELEIYFLVKLIEGEGNDNPLQYSCLENLMDRGAWWATVHGVAQSWTRLMWLSSSSNKPTDYMTSDKSLSFSFLMC